MNPFLLALQNAAPINTAPVKAAATRQTVSKNPTGGLLLRVYKDGSVFPSQELVDRFNLEYGNLVAESEEALRAERGFDVFLAHDLPNFPKDTVPNAILVSPVAKSEAKVDLFGRVRYNEDGTPVSSVMTQGSATFGADGLIPMLEILLNKESSEIFAEQKFVDILVDDSFALPLATDFAYIPKKVQRGADKGKLQLARRVKPEIFSVVLVGQEEVLVTELQPSSSEEEATAEGSTQQPEVAELSTL